MEIPKFAVKMFSYVNENVLDPFSGLGTSVKIAAELDRNGIGIERDLTIKNNVYNFIGKKGLSELDI
jgi:DNA modification methylase